MSEINALTGNMREFSQACYNQNSIGELEDALACVKPIIDDCDKWGITLKEYRTAVRVALRELISDNE